MVARAAFEAKVEPGAKSCRGTTVVRVSLLTMITLLTVWLERPPSYHGVAVPCESFAALTKYQSVVHNSSSGAPWLVFIVGDGQRPLSASTEVLTLEGKKFRQSLRTMLGRGSQHARRPRLGCGVEHFRRSALFLQVIAAASYNFFPRLDACPPPCRLFAAGLKNRPRRGLSLRFGLLQRRPTLLEHGVRQGAPRHPVHLGQQRHEIRYCSGFQLGGPVLRLPQRLARLSSRGTRAGAARDRDEKEIPACAVRRAFSL